MREYFHENPERLHVNTEPNRSYFIPFPREKDPFADREESERFVLLNGEWDFKFYKSVQDVEEDFLERELTDQIPVPSNWQLHGFEKPGYLNVRYPIPYDPPYVPDENPAGLYKRSFQVDLSDGLERYLNFEGVDSCFYLYINGQFAGYSQVTHMTSEFSITKYLKNGENTIAVLVLKWCDGTYLECQDKWRLSGIIRDVYLLARPKKRIRNYVIETACDKAADQAQIQIRVEADAKVEAVLRDEEGNVIDRKETRDGQAAETALCLTVPSPHLWNAEKPYLYSLLLRTEEESVGEKIGLRTIEVKDGVVLINGVPVKFKGVNRHDSSPYTGAVAAKEDMLQDLYLMKRHNINAIRTSHYPNAPVFLKLCDELGFYVIDEADNEAHGSVDASQTTDNNGDYSGIALLVNDSRFEQAILDRIQMMVQRDRNRTCVVMWSMGNESGYSKAFERAARWIKKEDPARLVHYESIHFLADAPLAVDSEETIDTVSRMYASPQWIADDFLKKKEEKRPFLLCEYCHAMGNGPGDLEDYWQLFYENERLCGGFVWEWCDHSVYEGKAENGKDIFTYGGDHGELIHDGNFCVDGLVYPDRRPHTGLKEVKNVYRPVRVRAVDAAKGEYEFFNTCHFTSLSEAFDCRYEVTEQGRVTLKGNIAVKAGPGEKAHMVIPELSGLSGESLYVRFIFTYQKAALWAEAGYETGFDQICICRKERKLSCTGKTAPGLKETDRLWTIYGENFRYEFDRRKGLFGSMEFAGEKLLEKPMEFNAFRAPVDNDPGVKEAWYRFRFQDLMTKVYDLTQDMKDDCVEITGHMALGCAAYYNTFDLRSRIRVYGNGQVQLAFDVKVADKRPYLPRFGLRLFLNKAFSEISYYGYGPYESYPDKRRASYKGVFSENVEQMHEDYIKPQENSSHYGCEYVQAANERIALKAEAAADFSFNASRYTQEELSQKKHNYELEQSDYTVLCLDYRQSGVGSSSCGPALLEKYRFDEKAFTMEFLLTPRIIG